MIDILLRKSDITSEFNSDPKWGGIIFTESAERQMGNITGFIRGLFLAGKEKFAEKLATDIASQLEIMSEWGPDVKHVLYSDCSPLSFGWSMYLLCKDVDKYRNDGEEWADFQRRMKLLSRTKDGYSWQRWDSKTSHEYMFAMNGGLMYNGPGRHMRHTRKVMIETTPESFQEHSFWRRHS